MRIRERDLESNEFNAYIDYYSHYSWKNDINSVGTRVATQSMSGTEHTEDVVTPDFMARRNSGQIINNLYDNVKSWTTHVPLSFISQQDLVYNLPSTDHAEYNSNGIVLYNDPRRLLNAPALLPAASVEIDRLKNLAITQVWAKVNSAPAESLVTMAEAAKTIQSVTRLFQAALPLLKKLHQLREMRRNPSSIIAILGRANRRYSKKKKFVKMAKDLYHADAAKYWLEVRYGLRPIYYDIRDTVKAFNEVGSKRRTRFTATTADSAALSDTVIDVPDVYWGTSLADYLRTSSRSVVVSAGVLVESKMKTITVKEAFGLDHWLSLGWELVPYSFVVDWFLNTGAYVAALQGNTTVKPLTSWVTTRDLNTRTVEMTRWDRPKLTDPAYGYWTNDYLNWSGGKMTQTTQSVHREPNPVMPSLPSLNVRLNTAKLIDILALARRYGS
jgi:hypothetical protein